MVLVGSVILPHGTLQFDNPNSPSDECRRRYERLDDTLKPKFSRLYEGCCQAGVAIAALEPHLVIVHTPHGLCLTDSVAVSLNTSARGSAQWNQQWGEFQVDVELDKVTAQKLIAHLNKQGIKAEGLLAFSGVNYPLMWGEVIPLWYLTRTMQHKTKFIIVTQPRKANLGCVDETGIALGRKISDFIDTLDPSLRVVMAIGGDLSHVYSSSTTDPLYMPAPGWTLSDNQEAAVAMERALLGWAKAVTDFSTYNSTDPLPAGPPFWRSTLALPWLQKATKLNPTAYACGMMGFIVLHGLLSRQEEKVRESEEQGGVMRPSRRDSCAAGYQLFKPRVIACEAPTYYGMMAVTFTKANCSQNALH